VTCEQSELVLSLPCCCLVAWFLPCTCKWLVQVAALSVLSVLFVLVTYGELLMYDHKSMLLVQILAVMSKSLMAFDQLHNELSILEDELPVLVIPTTSFMMFLLAYAVTREADE
jgi:hypothetical protein